MIKIYPSPLANKPEAEYSASGTLSEWLDERYPGRTAEQDSRLICVADGEVVPPSEWSRVDVSGDVSLTYKPQGDVTGDILAVFTLGLSNVVFDALTDLLSPDLPGIGRQSQGSQFSPAELKANTPQLNGPIPEGFGRWRRYPDYLLPPRRRFVNQTDQELKAFLCVGKGEYQINSGDVYVGDTSVSNLVGTVDVDIYDPGEDVSGDDKSDWWHTAPEVSATSGGSAGLSLEGDVNYTTEPSISNYNFYFKDITALDGAFPDDWIPGLVLRIEVPRDYTVSSGGTGGRNIISGDFTELAPFVGMDIEIAGDNAGLYTISSVTGLTDIELNDEAGDPVTALPLGSASMSIGYRNLQYTISSLTETVVSVERLDDTGSADLSWGGFFPSIDLSNTEASVTVDDVSDDGPWAGPFAACPDGEVVDTVEVDIFFPQGLSRITGGGSWVSHTVSYEIQYRDISVGGAWTSLEYTKTERTNDQIGFTESISLGSEFRPEVRVRRKGAASTSNTVRDTIQWYGLKGKIVDPPSSYAGVTTIGVRTYGGSNIAAQTENKISVICTRLLPTRSGGAWTAATATRDISAAVGYIADSVGYTDDQIDLDELDRLHDIWAARGDTFDHFFGETTTAEALNTALRVGFSEMTIDGGKIKPVRDEVRTVYEQMYTPQNMTQELTRSFTSIRPDENDGVDVEYVDGDTWTNETVECRLSGDLGLNVTKVKIEGVTDRDKAWRIGMRLRRAQKYRRWNYGFSTELDALNSGYLSYVALADDIPGYGKSSLLLSLDDQTLTVSEPMEWNGGPYLAAIRDADGSLIGPFSATRGDSDYEIVVSGLTYDMPPQGYELPHVLFGTTTRWNFAALIKEIAPNGDDQVSVTAVNYDERVYADDDNTAP